MNSSPRLSFVTTVGEVDPDLFERTVRSVLAQSVPAWEWVLVDCGSSASVTRRIDELTATDERISTAAPTGDVVARLGQHDALTPRAAEFVLRAFARADEVDVVYTDHDEWDAEERSSGRYLKPDWSPERLRHHEYVGDLVAVRSALLTQVGAMPVSDEPVAAHDLLLRVGERARRVEHVAKVLYHRGPRRTAADPAAEIAALTAHLDRVGIQAEVSNGHESDTYRVVRRPDVTTPVSVIIPTIGSRGEVWGKSRTYVVDAVASVADASEHLDVEFVIVYDEPTPEPVLEELRRLRQTRGLRLRLIVFPERFNFSAKCNVGASHARGEVFVFLNDDMQARSEHLLETLIAPLAEDGVGATGGKLFFEDGRVQHGGVRFGSGHLSDGYRLSDPDSPGDRGELWINREVTALTGACVAVRREVYERVGGFSEKFPMNFNDVDFSLKILREGLRNVWLHDVQMWHFESVTRDNAVSPAEFRRLEARWGDRRRIRERFSNGVR